jgi:hypothetical protein
VRPVISADGRGYPTIKRIIGWGKDLNQQGITGGNITGMFGGTIPAWTGRKRAQQINFCEEF